MTFVIGQQVRISSTDKQNSFRCIISCCNEDENFDVVFIDSNKEESNVTADRIIPQEKFEAVSLKDFKFSSTTGVLNS